MMEEEKSPVRRWEDLNIDMLVKIFQSFDVFQLIAIIPQVCPAWQSTFSDQRLWKTLDLSVMQSNFIRISIPQCPRLKHLVMPAWEKLKKQTICSAFHEWKDLESLTMPSLEEPAYVIEKIGRSCKKNFRAQDYDSLRYTVCICTGLISPKLECFECDVYGLI
ncbi:hypothetical protein H5410_001877 [Solanum commersonii]|uniref:F-box domain-containing protein n=1 Tax=Solanum commersonii TaxID=4109 RepID=A0A9J6B0B6_SOLCO|nr:hypothetical protein H5410_001877 [Solanum commersonii]